MTTQSQIINDEKYSPYLDCGFVGLIDHMGSDESIEFAARMSYGQGTRTVNDRRNLIRYLVRHKHTSPIEMGEVCFHLKMPIFVARQFVRHRTASLNEYSARYSELSDEMYLPPIERLQAQSTTNKQGSGGQLGSETQETIREKMGGLFDDSYDLYKDILESGLSRELSRIVMPVAGYTELVWKIDLHNFLHFCKLRLDPHAQEEIRVLAELMYNRVKVLFPIVTEAFDDYVRNARTFSRMELIVLRDIYMQWVTQNSMGAGEIEKMCESVGMGKRETTEFLKTLTTGE